RRVVEVAALTDDLEVAGAGEVDQELLDDVRAVAVHGDRLPAPDLPDVAAVHAGLAGMDRLVVAIAVIDGVDLAIVRRPPDRRGPGFCGAVGRVPPDLAGPIDHEEVGVVRIEVHAADEEARAPVTLCIGSGELEAV